MSTLKNLIAQLEAEDEQRKKEDKKHFEEQYKKYEEMQKRITSLTDESKKYMDNITKGLDQLVANKHTIEQAVKQTENLSALSIPQEQHGNIINLVSTMTEFMNKVESLNNQSLVLPSEIHQDVILVSQNVSEELRNIRNEFVDTQTLHDKIKQLKQLSTYDSFVDDVQDFNHSVF